MDACSSPKVSTTKNSVTISQSLKVVDLIDPIDRTWNVALLNEHFHPDDVKTIRCLAVSRTQRIDTYGWMFTESGKYTVKS